MKPTVYIENSVISYLAARPSSNLRVIAWQEAGWDWWDNHRHQYEVYVSEHVLAEASRGDGAVAQMRLDYCRDIPLLQVNDEAEKLAGELISKGGMPPSEYADALHVALAAVYGIDLLLTWNCTHINNPQMKPTVRKICADAGYLCPEICLPEELLGDTGHG